MRRIWGGSGWRGRCRNCLSAAPFLDVLSNEVMVIYLSRLDLLIPKAGLCYDIGTLVEVGLT
jgi:hypothetical protein